MGFLDGFAAPYLLSALKNAATTSALLLGVAALAALTLGVAVVRARAASQTPQ